jgi:hypothetical protein
MRGVINPPRDEWYFLKGISEDATYEFYLKEKLSYEGLEYIPLLSLNN